MGKTKRNAGHWFENKIKNKDQCDLGNLWWDYTNPRCVQRIRRKSKTFYSQRLDPRTLKPLGWKEYESDYKAKSKRNARRAAKILVKIEAHTIMQEVWDDYWADMWSMDEDDWYENHPNWFDYSFTDEAEDYLELRRQQEDDFYENQNQTYELDWYYDEYC